MALDGAFLRHLKQEIEQRAIGARVDKIYQPNRDELVLFLRTRGEMWKLLMSARANSPRVHFIQRVPENPQTPPMLCMLLRKRLTGAKLTAVRQPGLERLLQLEFEAVNELGDHIVLTLVAEVMGKYSNIILVDDSGVVVDALKRVDTEMSSQRLVLPGVRYELPPAQDKLCMLEMDEEALLERIVGGVKNEPFHKAMLNAMQGISPVVCREMEHLAGRGGDLVTKSLTDEACTRVRFFLGRLADTVRAISGKPYLVTDRQGKPLEFSFINITQYGGAAVVKCCESFSELLDEFYGERDRIERMRVKSQDLLRVLTNASDRLSRKVNAQRAELEQCAGRDQLRIWGDLLNANLYRVPKGASFVELENLYDEAQALERIRLDPALSATQNAQKYYKEYRKARTAEQMLTGQIALAQAEIAYLDTVFDALSRASTERELGEIRQELTEQGYLRKARGRQKPLPLMGPKAYRSSEGFLILVGRNNRQNDQLTLKRAAKSDWWFHTKNIPGSHTVVVAEGKTPGEETLLQAAKLAALHSRAKDSSQVPVDFTQVRHVSKPQGAKPGMVNYVDYRTLYVTPEPALEEQLRDDTK
jgi:predicted ribosome quality control (RQC) complex YloA/Tae2 family protein